MQVTIHSFISHFMNLSFYIHYNTQWGQQVALCGNLPEMGAENLDEAPRMHYKGNGWWEIHLKVAEDQQKIAYQYAIVSETGASPLLEWGDQRHLILSPKDREVTLVDSWRSHQAPENAYFSSAFSGLIFQPKTYQPEDHSSTSPSRRLRLQIDCPNISAGQRLCVLGNSPELGNWSYQDALLLFRDQGSNCWYREIQLDHSPSIEYKYGLYDEKTERILGLETGSNRTIDLDKFSSESHLFIRTDAYFRHPAGSWKGAGVAIPVFSIRTQKGLGTGEFQDIKKMVDWAAQTGLRMVQILPVNDTSATGTWKDSYPYSGISVFALHPLYLNIEQVGSLNEKDQAAYDQLRIKLNALPDVDYDQVMRAKLRFARILFDDDNQNFLKTDAFKAFFKEHSGWLRPFAVFCYLRDLSKTANFQDWDAAYTYSPDLVNKLTAEHSASFKEVAFHYYLQFHLDHQLREATAYARKNGVVLKGDLPIGIFRESADAWVAPELYNMDGQAGAPPDDFAVNGQNWGFPTYNWEQMAEDGYDWWKRRFRHMAHYFDAFRIDHILGFFRIWEIPYEQIDGIMGVFNKALPIHINEFKNRGIPFDYQRFCQPFITGSRVMETFGAQRDFVVDTFFDMIGESRFQLKENFRTQRQIADFLKNKQITEIPDLERNLFDLVSNVLFFEVPGSEGTLFHPRINFHNTFSFQTLSPEVRQKLDALYVDYFYHRQESFWEEQGMIKLPAIKAATNMLVCGEDLGMVPECVPRVMDTLGILSLEIQRMSKNPKTDFLASADIPYLSVCSPSTHDMAPLRAWWEQENPERVNRLYYEVLGMHGERPFYCEPYIIEAIIRQHLNFPSMWVVFPIQDMLGIDPKLRRTNPAEERINDPSNSSHYWRYRMHIDMEDLIGETAFNTRISDLVKASGR